MSTNLLYLTGFDIISAEAVITDIQEQDGRTDITLTQTCFYPRGGGQDYDQGVIRSDDSLFLVDAVILDEAGVVHHYGAYKSGRFEVGDTVTLAVDVARRELHTRLHSAGHLIDMAVDELGYDWIPGKGAHYPHMSNVEYTGEWDADNRDRIIADIQRLINGYVSDGGENEIRFMPKTEMSSVCRHVPDNLPANKPARVVMYRGSFGIPCGGTHVTDLSQVGGVKIERIKKKSGSIRVSYSVQ